MHFLTCVYLGSHSACDYSKFSIEDGAVSAWVLKGSELLSLKTAEFVKGIYFIGNLEFLTINK